MVFRHSCCRYNNLVLDRSCYKVFSGFENRNNSNHHRAVWIAVVLLQPPNRTPISLGHQSFLHSAFSLRILVSLVPRPVLSKHSKHLNQLPAPPWRMPGLEKHWNVGQVASLASIVAGVVLASSSSSSSNDDAATTATSWFSILCVLAANLCFSLRGLFQKLGQQREQQHTKNDDVQLQLSMQRMGLQLLILPVVAEHVMNSTVSWTAFFSSSYVAIAVMNGVAFTSYNLASTFILSRLTVVHHATLNCIRRVFAIVVTSLLFGVPITLTGAVGITMALVGFLQYTHYKHVVQQKHKEQPSILPTTHQTVSTTTARR